MKLYATNDQNMHKKTGSYFLKNHLGYAGFSLVEVLVALALLGLLLGILMKFQLRLLHHLQTVDNQIIMTLSQTSLAEELHACKHQLHCQQYALDQWKSMAEKIHPPLTISLTQAQGNYRSHLTNAAANQTISLIFTP